MNSLSKGHASWLEIDESADGQRIDNFLVKALKGVPRSHVYRILRSGEVRVNSGRISAGYRLQKGDKVRIPPIRLSAAPERRRSGGAPIGDNPLFEDDWLLAIDKPAGVAVHGGSGISMGVIERLREERPEQAFLELVHRLDRETSGVLMLAKRRPALTSLHRQLREGAVQKSYLVLVRGLWRDAKRSVKLPLQKFVLASGERRVSVRGDGLAAHTVFHLRRRWKDYSLLEAELKTGRTHQIRVHLAHIGFPIAGDEKYGDFALNRQLPRQGLKRMFLHAARIVIAHPSTGVELALEAPLPADLAEFLATLDAKDAHVAPAV